MNVREHKQSSLNPEIFIRGKIPIYLFYFIIASHFLHSASFDTIPAILLGVVLASQISDLAPPAQVPIPADCFNIRWEAKTKFMDSFNLLL